MKYDKKLIIALIAYVFLFFYNGYYLIHWGEGYLTSSEYQFDIVFCSLSILVSVFLLAYTSLFLWYMISRLNKKPMKVTKKAAMAYIALSIIALVPLFYLGLRSQMGAIAAGDASVFYLVLYTIRTFAISMGFFSDTYIIFRLVMYIKGDFPEIGLGYDRMNDGTSFRYEHPNDEVPRKRNE